MKSTGNKKQYSKPESIKLLEDPVMAKRKERFPNVPYLVKSTYTDSNTNGLSKCVIDYITLRGFHAERINSTGAIKDNRTTSTDVLGNIRTIGSVKIEIKCKATNDNIQSEAQIQYQKQIEAAGGVYIVIRNFTQFYDWFNDFIK